MSGRRWYAFSECSDTRSNVLDADRQDLLATRFTEVLCVGETLQYRVQLNDPTDPNATKRRGYHAGRPPLFAPFMHRQTSSKRGDVGRADGRGAGGVELEARSLFDSHYLGSKVPDHFQLRAAGRRVAGERPPADVLPWPIDAGATTSRAWSATARSGGDTATLILRWRTCSRPPYGVANASPAQRPPGHLALLPGRGGGVIPKWLEGLRRPARRGSGTIVRERPAAGAGRGRRHHPSWCSPLHMAALRLDPAPDPGTEGRDRGDPWPANQRMGVASEAPGRDQGPGRLGGRDSQQAPTSGSGSAPTVAPSCRWQAAARCNFAPMDPCCWWTPAAAPRSSRTACCLPWSGNGPPPRPRHGSCANGDRGARAHERDDRRHGPALPRDDHRRRH